MNKEEKRVCKPLLRPKIGKFMRENHREKKRLGTEKVCIFAPCIRPWDLGRLRYSKRGNAVENWKSKCELST